MDTLVFLLSNDALNEFVNEYRNPGRPVIFTDLTKDWPARGKFSPEFFRTHHGHRPVTIGATTYKLGEFLDIPVRHYSTGMFVRLAFATSTAVDPQILLLDEVMAAGDKDFIHSARQRMNELMERASIVLFATHSLDVLPNFCERTILLSQGAIVADGPTEEVVQFYTATPPLPPGQTHELKVHS